MRIILPEEWLKIGLVSVLVVAECFTFGILIRTRSRDAGEAAAVTAQNRLLVSRLGLTDLALWSEARYVRHPSQADLFSPFGEHPSSLEHFPAGVFVPSPGAFVWTHDDQPYVAWD